MAGRRHRAQPGEPTCGVDGCERPAGFATATPGEGPCRRHGGLSRTQSSEQVDGDPGEPLNGAEAVRDVAPRRLRGPGRPTPEPLALVRLILTSARRAGLPFEEAWRLAAEAALSYMSDRRAEEWWDVLAWGRSAWADAYEGRRSRFAAFPREVPPPRGLPFAGSGGKRGSSRIA